MLRRRARFAPGDHRPRSRMGAIGRDPGDREVSRRTDERAHRARIMDTVAAVAFARELIDIDSTTGREQAAGEWLASRLAHLGYTVERQPVGDGRFNVVATLDRPSVVFSTHFDCVPPFIPSDVRGDS